ncbi:exopolysaccharide biosynthesis polyprenyl glycosylphosphotransferase [Streptomyces sp. NBC_00344]|uniref:exopolysaccharide biosynthesis polyprenyl glycosylphosphotransferase n=1 Tax=Streptomyces sp. NBC_00344 TaxID=2975720 RepID=UPI002E1AD701
MTMDSAQAPHTGRDAGRATAVQSLAPAIHPPRRSDAGHTLTGRALTRRGRSGAPLIAADVLAMLLTIAVVPGLRLPAVLIVPLAALLLALHTRRGLHVRRLSPSALFELPALTCHALIVWCTADTALASFGDRQAPDWQVLAAAVTAQTVIGCAGRALVHRGGRWLAARRTRSTLIIGDGAAAQQVGAALYAHPGYGMRPVGIVGTGPAAPDDADDQEPPVLPVLATHEDIGRAVIQTSVRHALFLGPGTGPEDTGLLQLLAEHGVRMWLVGPAGHEVAGAPVDHLWGFAVRPLGAAPAHRAQHWGKRGLDISLALPALLVAAPVMALCALAVRVCDGPGVVFRQERVGVGGRPFTLLKFRTLRPADEHESATRWSVAQDHRMGRIGTLLRRTSLDELPQLWNVVRGDMSLVGPRPERPYFVAKFSGAHPGYRARHRMPVGITGLAQVNGLRGDTSIEDRARFDNLYIDTWSLWQDVCILARTATSLLRLGGS